MVANNFKDIPINTVINHWTVLAFGGRDPKRLEALWKCRCQCGMTQLVKSWDLRTGHSKSCGCMQNVTHGHSFVGKKTPEWLAYNDAKQRCSNPNNPAYKDYGERGIRVEFASFEEFLADIGARPSPDLSLDRINNDGHYEAGNVRWATRSQQIANSRHAHYVTHNNETLLSKDWSDRLGIRSSTMSYRLQHWCEPCAVTLPKHAQCPHRGYD